MVMSKFEPISTIEFPLPGDLHLNLSGMDILIVRITHLIKADKPWKIDSHAHLNWEFHYVISGSGTVITINNSFHVSARHLYITPPFSLHKQISDSNCLEEYCIECNLIPPLTPRLEFAGDELQRFFNARDSFSASSFIMPNETTAMHTQLQQSFQNTPTSLIRIEGILLHLMSEYIFHATASSRKKKLPPSGQTAGNHVLAIKNYLDANICNPITVQDIANLMFMSSRQIDRIFYQKYNMTTFQYLQNLRTKAAVNLIQNSDLSFAKIAQSTGFPSYRQMVRTLHLNGYDSPSEIRQDKKAD